MKTQKKRTILAAVLGATCAMPMMHARADHEFGDNTPFYEDDSWYDVSEWFDGNDYNPTDEAIGRWDDELFTYADNATSSDNDNFLNWGDYGYNSGNESDWFYDYYDDGYATWENRFYSNYYDTNDDGVYDAYSSYSDTDGDGLYEDFNYYTFNSDADDQEKNRMQAKSQQKEMKSTEMQVSGNVEDTKMVNVRDRIHLIAMVSQSNGQPMMVDLGPDQAEVQLFKGDRVSATGHVMKVGEKSVLVANEASMKNGTIAIDRSGKKYQGTIEKVKTVSVRGTERKLAKVKTANDKTMMVDLGPASNLDSDLEQGAKITVQGVPVKVKDRVILMAHKIMHDGDQTRVDRRVAQAN
ncbi:hypothetical protein LF1_40410 [Rubripirellula obstinata]|uniref:Magnetosome protein MamS/MamX domain-containing protein n=1 Tax=Rubripirellula obstinata TaxID=406547 RepID=A0A5B1CMI2_9BACT|nr:hypothetical protein [Rubripirellula obstinata]KAA1261491.1 hypothetical protein LF1_40410 [Rubripirellula obstinata]